MLTKQFTLLICLILVTILVYFAFFNNKENFKLGKPITKEDGSCIGKCGGKGNGSCWCDKVCESLGDCCLDKKKVCNNKTPDKKKEIKLAPPIKKGDGSCQGSCGGKGKFSDGTKAKCYCDSLCKKIGDCCIDKLSYCTHAGISKTGMPVTQTPVMPVTQTPVMPVTQTPGMPVTQTPGMPVTQTPVMPVTQTPVMPGVQQQPVMPGMPGVPQQPVMPGVPQQPVMPGVPQQPVMPGMPGVQQPGMSGMPGVQQQPVMPGVQQASSSFEGEVKSLPKTCITFLEQSPKKVVTLRKCKNHCKENPGDCPELLKRLLSQARIVNIDEHTN